MITASEWKKATESYIDNTKRIRELSSTHMNSNQTAKEYYETLKSGFENIRVLAEDNSTY